MMLTLTLGGFYPKDCFDLFVLAYERGSVRMLAPRSSGMCRRCGITQFETWFHEA